MKFPSLRCLSMCWTVVLLLGCLALASVPEGRYHLLKKVSFAAAEGGEEFFDMITVDASTRRVYVSHGTEVKVVNADTGTEVGNITGLKRVHGIALVKELGKGFISDSGPNQVVIFDLKTLKVTGRVKTGADTDTVIYDPASKLIFSFNDPDAKSVVVPTNDVTIIDPAKQTVVKTIPLGSEPEYAVADGKGMIYNNLESTGEMAVIDTRALTIKARWPTAPLGAPAALAMDLQHRRLFSSGLNPPLLVVMDADNGKVIQSFPISAGADASDYDPETHLVFVSTREGMIHIFHEDSPDKFSVVDAVKTEYGAKTMALDPKTHNVFVDTSDFGPAPAPTAKHPHPNPVQISGTFRLLIYGR
jgi:hypothetical protein